MSGSDDLISPERYAARLAGIQALGVLAPGVDDPLWQERLQAQRAFEQRLDRAADIVHVRGTRWAICCALLPGDDEDPAHG